MATPTAKRHGSSEDYTPKAPSISPIKASPRRVLQELTPNAKVASQRTTVVATEKATTTPYGSPLKYQQTVTPTDIISPGNQNIPSPYRSSKKRAFDQIADTEDHASPVRKTAVHSSEVDDTATFPFPAGLARPPIITILPMPDEENASSTDEDVPELEHDEEDNDSQIAIPSQEVAGSFSSLIDYDPANASDKSASAASSPAATVPVTSIVENLKLTLNLAMYKVKTNQTLVPFSQLLLPHHALSRGPRATQPQPNQLKVQVETTTLGPFQATESLVPKNIVIGGGQIAKLGPGPVLLPTAYSSRMIEEDPSPPSSVPEGDESAMRTPMANRRASALMESPDKDLTSSGVRGRAAASGLLELMRAR